MEGMLTGVKKKIASIEGIKTQERIIETEIKAGKEK